MDADQNPSVTLDQIRDGGARHVVLANERLRELEDALNSGKFSKAHMVGVELVGKLQALAWAESNLSLGGGMIVRAKNLEPGMTIIGHGVVSETIVVQETGCDHAHVHIAFENDTDGFQVAEDTEIIVHTEG